MSDLIQINQYPVPEEKQQRLDFAVKMIWAGVMVLVILVLSTIWVGVTDPSGIWPMLLLTVLPGAAICGWGFFWHHRNSQFEYEANGIRVIFQGPEYYVPKDQMEKLVQSVYEAWEPHLEIPPQDLYRGIILEVVIDRPIFPVDGREVVGLTYNDKRLSQIWGPYALSRGGAAYELLLHGAEYQWPLMGEGYQIKQMRKHGVFALLGDSFRKYDLE